MEFSGTYAKGNTFLLFTLFLILSTLVGVSQAETGKSVTPAGMLPETASPTHYSLNLDIDPELGDFAGIVKIDIDIHQPVDHFYIHGKHLTIETMSLAGNDQTFDAAKILPTDLDDVLKVSAGSTLVIGQYRLTISYKAPFNGNLEGIYRVKEGDQHFIFSQMQAIAARLAFPSFDEPRFKTPFDVSVTTKSDLSVIANAPEHSVTSEDDGVKTVTFATSKPIPTYLFALAVGDFDIVEWLPIAPTEVRNFSIPLRGIALRGKGKDLAYALEHTAAVLNALEDYFQIPYPYKKLDILAVPDFAAGAMENPGAITYREQLLLLDDKASISQKRRYKYVHSHELAHQWFGNLVTPRWWNDIWLNEAFATWIGHIALHRHFPEEQWRRELVSDAQNVMNSDSIPSSRKIRNPIQNNGDILTAFDGITYQKGSSVLTMFEAFIGEERFRNGVQKYMQKYAWGTTDAFDFMEMITAEAGKENSVILMNSFRDFIEQVGVPLLNVTSECKDNRTNITLRQERYKPLGTEFKNNTQWKIPACFVYETDGVVRNQCELVTQPQQTVTLDTLSCVDWTMPNANASGYYRFNMDSKGWQSLFSNMHKLSEIEAGAIVDSFEAAYNAGTISLSDYLAVLPETLKSDSWEVRLSGLGNLVTLISFANDEHKNALRQLGSDIYKQAADEMGFETTTELDKSSPIDAEKLRTGLVSFMGATAKDKSYIKKLASAGANYIGFKKSEADNAAIHSSLVGPALANATRENGLPFAKALVDSAMTSTDSTFRGRAFNALATTEENSVAQFLMPFILNEEIKDNEAISFLFGLMRNDKLDSVTWPWIQKNFDRVVERMPSDYHAFLPYLFSRGCSETALSRMEALIKPKLDELVGAAQNYNKAEERLAQCIAQKAHFVPQIEAVLSKQE